MAKGDRRSDLFRLFVRSKRTKNPAHVKPVHVRGQDSRVTDALAATRAMRPTVVHPEDRGSASAPRELTVIRPPVPPRPAVEPHLRVDNRRLRFSVSYLACGTLAVAFALLLLVAFVLGMRYEHSRGRAAAPGEGLAVRTEGNTVRTADGSRGTDGSPLMLGVQGTQETPPAAGALYRLRIAFYVPSDRQMAEKSVATLTEKGVAVDLLTRRIDGRDRLVIYSRQQFPSRSSPEALSFQRKVQMIKQNERYDFTSAYYVVVD